MKTFIFFILALLVSTHAWAQPLNRIHIEVDPEELKHALVQPQKYQFKSASAKVALMENGAEIKSVQSPASVSIRGQNCLKSPRRCLSLKLQNKVALAGSTNLKAKSFNLISMWEDQGYVSSKIGFEMFRALGLFDFRTEYSEVLVNGQSWGLYLVAEKPSHAASRVAPNVFVARRGVQYRIEVAKSAEEGARHSDIEYIQAFKNLYSDLKVVQGLALRERINKSLDLPEYMSWLAVNSLLRNGDYSDEVYFFADTTQPSIYFHILPWDMDDLFRPPHAGALNRARMQDLQTRLLYSYENPLDIKIGDDPVLYDDFRSIMSDLLMNRATDRFIDTVIETVRDSIEPYLSSPDILNGGLKDRRKKPYTKVEILNLLERRGRDLRERREVLKSRLDQ